MGGLVGVNIGYPNPWMAVNTKNGLKSRVPQLFKNWNTIGIIGTAFLCNENRPSLSHSGDANTCATTI
jgi:hypothetical protein